MYAVWKGGSTLGKLANFAENWITKEEYEEAGDDIVEVKCPS